jgi:hypothetical protein
MLPMLSGCLLSAHTEVSPSTRPTTSMEGGSPVQASACTAFLFGMLPLGPADSGTVERLLEEVTSRDTYVVVNLAVDQRMSTFGLGTQRCVRVSGRRIPIE